MTQFINQTCGLNAFARSVTSQNGEDGIIAHALDILGADCNRWCVEFGAWDGKHLSNTFQLIESRGYAAVLIEGDQQKFQTLQNNFKHQSKVVPLCQFVGFNPQDSLDAILKRTNIPRNFDLLSIDIDGNDYHVWDAIEDYRPKIVVIEFNPSIPTAIEFVQSRDMSICQGSSLLSIDLLARRKGYQLVATTPANAIFVDEKYFPQFKIADNSLSALRVDESQVAYLFQGYDGTLFVRGCTQLVWHGVELNESRMQYLPAWLRRHPAQLGRWRRKVMKWFRWRSKKAA
jgi:hypothetical protein